MSKQMFHLSLFTAFSIGLLGGCGGDPNVVPVYPAKGKLTMGGEAFGPTVLQLHPTEEDGRMVVGEVDEQGNITLTTFDRGDGAPAGKYRVLVAMRMGAPPRPMPKIYRSADKSPLYATITEADMNELDLQMDPKAGPLIGGPGSGASKMSAAQESLMNPKPAEE